MLGLNSRPPYLNPVMFDLCVMFSQVASQMDCVFCVSSSTWYTPSTASQGSACLWKRLSMVIIIQNKMLHPLHIIMPLMLITVLVINDSLNN